MFLCKRTLERDENTGVRLVIFNKQESHQKLFSQNFSFFFDNFFEVELKR